MPPRSGRSACSRGAAAAQRLDREESPSSSRMRGTRTASWPARAREAAAFAVAALDLRVGVVAHRRGADCSAAHATSRPGQASEARGACGRAGTDTARRRPRARGRRRWRPLRAAANVVVLADAVAVDDAHALADAVLDVGALARVDRHAAVQALREHAGHRLRAQERVAARHTRIGGEERHRRGSSRVTKRAVRPTATALTTGAACLTPYSGLIQPSSSATERAPGSRSARRA